jgi:hypothetical protein
MKFLISYISIDTTVSDELLGGSSTMSNIRHEIVSTVAHEYSVCDSIRDVEAAFERLHNYADSDDHLTQPQCKIKVLKVDALPNESRAA